MAMERLPSIMRQIVDRLGSIATGNIVLLSVAALLAIYCIVLLYRLTFHPLARYPGPLSLKLSSWPLVYYCIKGNRHIKELLAHEKYGPIVRTTPDGLSFRTPAALKAIYGPSAHVKKGDWYSTLDISAGAPSIQMVIDQHQHALRRRVMSPAFSERALRDAEPLIAANAQKLCNKLSKAVLGSATKKGEWSKGFDLLTWVSYYGYDFISDLSFGRSFELLDHETHRYVPSTLKSASQFLYYVGYLPFAALVRPLMGTPVQGLFPGQSAKDSLKYTQLANGRLAARIEEEKTRKKGGEVGGGRKDVFHYLLNSKDPSTGRAFTVEELQADTSVLIAAGSDGVTVTVCALFFYALQHPAILKKLTAEIRTAFDGRALNEGEEPANAIKTPQLNHLPYLNACIDESLRLAPPKPGSLPRIVLSGGTEIDGEYIPAGTTVGVSHYVIHRNADIFDSPSEFRPERWILGNEKEGYVSQEQLANQKSAFCPFGIGPMNCIGKNMAYLAIRLAVVHLLMRFDFRVDGELGLVGGGNREDVEVGRRDEGEYQLWDWIIGFPRGPRVQVRLR